MIGFLAGNLLCFYSTFIYFRPRCQDKSLQYFGMFPGVWMPFDIKAIHVRIRVNPGWPDFVTFNQLESIFIMLNVLRKQAQSTLIQGLVLLIAIVFIFWGVGANMNNNRNSVATVNGREISYQDFQRAYEQSVENFRQQFGGQVPPGLMEQMGIKQQVLARLIQAELLRQGGEEMGLTVSASAVQREIEKMPVFQRDGHFDLKRYKTVLSQNRLTPTSFEDGLQADLQMNRVRDCVGSFAMVPDSMIRDWLAFRGEEIQLSYVVFDAADFEKDVEIEESDLAAWFAENKEKYRSEPRVRLKYLFFSYDKDGQQVAVSDADLKSLYESNKESYQQPEERHARHILFKVSKDASDLDRAAKKKEAEQVLALANQGRDFAKLAEEYSEGPTKSRGGDLGFFARGRMVPSFDEAVFSMKQGEVSTLVETPFGYHIIKLEEIRPAKTRSFAEVKDSLAASTREQQARSLTFKRASKAYEDIMRAGNLDKYGEKSSEEVLVTPYFGKSDPPEGIVADPGFLKTALSLNKGELSSLVELDTGYAIIFVDDVQEPAVPELDAVREQVVADYTGEKAIELAGKAAADFLAESQEKGGIAAVAGSLQVHESGVLKRSSPVAENAPPPEVTRDGFQLSWNKTFAESPVQTGTVYYVYEITERRPGAAVGDAGRQEQIRVQLLASVRNELITSWLARVSKQAEIWTNDTLLQ